MYGRLMTVGLGAFCVLFVGCANDIPRGTVHGKVTVGDKPATAGEVKFHGANGFEVSTPILGDGTYKAVGIPVGETKITVHPAPMLATKSAPPKGLETISSTETSGVPESSSKSPPIPQKYSTTDGSGFSLKVVLGENSYDVAMAPGPAAPPPVKASLSPGMPGKGGMPTPIKR